MKNNKKNIKLIDGSMYLYRAYYSIPLEMNHAGMPLNAILGFVSSLSKILTDQRNGDVIVFFDSKSNKRQEIYDQYKANRREVDNTLIVQFDVAIEFLQSAKMQYFISDGYEADDLIASFCNKYKNQYDKFYIYSSDKDFNQLLDENIILVNTVKNTIYTIDDFKKEYQLNCSRQFIEIQALMGDSSDNIPGAKGIGPKTALKLIQEYQNIENLFDNYHNIKQKTLKSKIEDCIEDIKVSKKLATLNSDIDINMHYINDDNDGKISLNVDVLSFFEKYNLESLKNNFIDKGLVEYVQNDESFENEFFVDGIENLHNQEKYKIKIFNKYPKNASAYPFEDLSVMHFCATGIKFNKNIFKNIFNAYNAIKNKMYKNKQTKFYHLIDKPIIPAMHYIMKNGIKVDINFIDKIRDEYKEKIDALQKEIFEIIGKEFLLNSSKQTLSALNEYLDVNLTSTDANTLSTINDPVVKLIMQYRSYQKIYSDQLLSYIKMHINGFIFPEYHQDTIITGRISATKPNIHNMPRDIKPKVLIPRNNDRVLVHMDYSQLELRIAAFISNDPILNDAFNRNIDIHKDTAVNILKIPACNITTEQRQIGKVVNFGVIYGMSAHGILQRGLVDNIEDGKSYLNTYFNIYKDIKKYIENIKRQWENNGYVENIFNRKIYGVRNHRSAINAPIQGSAADILKSAIVDIYELIRDDQDILMITQIHDELIFDIKKDKIHILDKIKNIMARPSILKSDKFDKLKLIVDVKIK